MMHVLHSMQVLSLCAMLLLLSGHAGATGEGADVQLELQSSLSSDRIRAGETVKLFAWMTRHNVVQTSVDLKRHLRMAAYIQQPDGSRFNKALFDNGLDGDLKAEDGIFTCQFAADWTGEYHVRIIAEGKGFRKEREHLFQSARSGKEEDAGQQRQKERDSGTSSTGKSAPSALAGNMAILVNGILALFWITAFGYLTLKARRGGTAAVRRKDADFRRRVQILAEGKLKGMASDEKAGQGGAEAEGAMIAELHAARRRFLEEVVERTKKSKDDLPAIWREIYGSFDETVKAVLQGKKTLREEKEVLQERVEEIGGITEELKGAKALADAQARKIAFLMSFKDVFTESQQKIDALKRKSRDLEQKLFDAAQQAGVADAMKAPLAEFGEQFKQLELCVTTLERENERLSGEINKWQKELEQVRQEGPAGVTEIPDTLLKENEDLKKRIRDLEAAVKGREKELVDASQRYESLEAEYMVLYQEKQAGQQQPDI